jgi:urease accessory protein
MLKADEILGATSGSNVNDTLTLPFELRQKSRLVADLDSGRQILLQLPRGTVLRHGTRLRASDGSVVEVRAAKETLSVVESQSSVSLARAAYHLGNRHVPLQLDAHGLRYQHDHVLDQMLVGLGLLPRVFEGPFEPEHGAYGHGTEHATSAHGHEH